MSFSFRQSVPLLLALGRYLWGLGLRRSVSGRTLGSLPPPHVIHLDRRADRREQFDREFRQVGLTPIVFDAIEDRDGALGCALSHRAVLSRAAVDSALWVCEDDVVFDLGRQELEQVIRDFLTNDGLDVLCLAHKTRGPTVRVSRHLAISVSSATTASYLVKPRAREALLKSFDQSAKMLALGVPRPQAAVDVHWQQLQRRTLVFSVPVQESAHQAGSFSNVEGRDVDYYGERTK